MPGGSCGISLLHDHNAVSATTDVLVMLQAARSSYEGYISLAEQHVHHTSSAPHNSSLLLCDRCLQPIEEETFRSNACRLEVGPAGLLCLLLSTLPAVLAVGCCACCVFTNAGSPIGPAIRLPTLEAGTSRCTLICC